MGLSPADKERAKEKFEKVLLNEDVNAGLSQVIEDFRDELLATIDSPESTEKLYQAIGGRKACTNLLVRLEAVRNTAKEKKADEESLT
jgi:hypothetical protein